MITLALSLFVFRLSSVSTDSVVNRRLREDLG